MKVDALVDITFKASSEIKVAEVEETLKECPDVKCTVIGKTFESKFITRILVCCVFYRYISRTRLTVDIDLFSKRIQLTRCVSES